MSLKKLLSVAACSAALAAPLVATAPASADNQGVVGRNGYVRSHDRSDHNFYRNHRGNGYLLCGNRRYNLRFQNNRWYADNRVFVPDSFGYLDQGSRSYSDNNWFRSGWDNRYWNDNNRNQRFNRCLFVSHSRFGGRDQYQRGSVWGNFQ